MNFSDWLANSTVATFLPSAVNPLDGQGLDSALNTTDNPALSSNKTCAGTLTSESPVTSKLPGSLDALFYIIIVLLFYAFSIVVLMVKYIRREREEANVRNYYYGCVAQDKFRSSQHRNRQFMKRIFCKGCQKDDHTVSTVEEEDRAAVRVTRNTSKHKNQTQIITKKGSPFNRLVTDSNEVMTNKDNCAFLGVKNQFYKNSFFGKKFCNKQLCSKCVSESIPPTIDWDDGRNSHLGRNNHKLMEDTAVRLYQSEQSHSIGLSSYKRHNQNDMNESDYFLERESSIFFPIIECDSDVENEDVGRQQVVTSKWNNENVLVHVNYNTAPGEAAIVSSCSLEISRLLANMPPLDAVSTSNDMDTLDGLSNLNSEAGSQSLLNYSASMKGTNSVYEGHSKENPGIVNKSASGEDRLKDLSDFLSERTSLLSCTLSIDDGEDEDIVTNLSSAKHIPNGLSLGSSSNGKAKDDTKSNGKSVLNSLSKSLSSDEGGKKAFLTSVSNFTDESGVFKNLKYFLRGFSKDGNVKEGYETLNLLPRETYFGPGSPQSCFGNGQKMKVLTKCDLIDHSYKYTEMNTMGNDFYNLHEYENCGKRSGLSYDTEDEVHSEEDKSSSFGDYFMGEASESQVIDISKPLVRRQLDPETKDILSRTFIGLGGLHQEFPHMSTKKVDPTGSDTARKETKV